MALALLKSCNRLAQVGSVWSWLVAAAGVMALGSPGLAGLNVYTPFETIHGWLIERQTSVDGEHRCRASIPSGGAWFSANPHLDRNDQLIVPAGIHRDVEQAEIRHVRLALKRCRSTLYVVE